MQRPRSIDPSWINAMCPISRIVLVLTLTCPAALSQSFNVDIGPNQVFGTPSSNYGAGAAQPGVWLRTPELSLR